MAAVDIVIVSIIVLSIAFGFARGFCASCLSLIGWFNSFFLAFVTFPLIEPLLSSKFESRGLVLLLGHTGLLIFYLILFGILNLILNILLKPLTKGVVDRSFGILFGFGRALLIVVISCVIYVQLYSAIRGIDNNEQNFAELSPQWLSKSKWHEYIVIATNKGLELSPQIISSGLDSFYSDLNDSNFDQRFVQYAISQMENALDAEDLKRYNKILNNKTTLMNEDEIEYFSLKLLYKIYTDRAKDGMIDDRYQLSSTEAIRLSNILYDMKHQG